MNEEKFAGVCVIDDGKILLVQEAHEEAHGLWSLPLGHVEKDEEESETAIREIKEETGYDVELGEDKVLVIKGIDFKSTNNFSNTLIKLRIFDGKIKSGVLKPGNDVLDAKWFSLNDFNKLPLRGNWLKFFIQNRF